MPELKPFGRRVAIDYPFEFLHVTGVSDKPDGPQQVALMIPMNLKARAAQGDMVDDAACGPWLTINMNQEECDRLLIMIYECRRARGWTGALEPGPFKQRVGDKVRDVRPRRRK